MAFLFRILFFIPASNAGSEIAFSFSQVGQIKIHFHSKLSTETVCRFNKASKCCEVANIEDAL